MTNDKPTRMQELAKMLREAREEVHVVEGTNWIEVSKCRLVEFIELAEQEIAELTEGVPTLNSAFSEIDRLQARIAELEKELGK